MKRSTLLSAILVLSSLAGFADPGLEPAPKITEITSTSFNIDWDGTLGNTYFIQYSADLISWDYMPMIKSGTGGPLGYGFDAAGGKLFLRLHYTATPTNSPFSDDFDNDGISNWDEVKDGGSGTSPLIEDTDGDGIRDDGLVYAAINDPDGAGLISSLQNGLIGRWDLEENNGSNIVDSSGKNWSGILDYSNSADQLQRDPLGMVSRGVKFPGNNRGWMTLQSKKRSEDKFSASFWFRMTADSGNGRFRMLLSAATEAGGSTFTPYVSSIKLGIWNANIVRIDTSRGQQTWTVPKNLDDGKWHHLCYSRYSSNKGKVYIDGENLGEKTLYYWEFNNDRSIYFVFGQNLNRYPIVIGSSLNSLEGSMDRIRFYNRKLSAVEIEYLHHSDIDNDGLWDITENESLLWRDINGNGLKDTAESNYTISPYSFDLPDTDHDGDGISSLDEQNNAINPTSAVNPDTDGDLLPDGWELNNGFDPNDPSDANLDSDNDGATNLVEYSFTSDPHNTDTDGDGTNDGAEINGADGNPNTAGGSNPNDDRDGGQPIPDEEKLTIKIGVGDQSGSHSEDYVMNIFRINSDTGEENRIYTLRSGGHGEYKEITQDIFRKSDTYTFQIDWQSSNLESSTDTNNPEGADYDYTFIVEPQGDVTSLLIGQYDPETKTADTENPIGGDKSDVESFQQTVEKKRIILLPVEIAPDVLAVNSDFDEGRIDPATGYAIPDCDDVAGVDRKTGAGNGELLISADRDHLDGTYSDGDRITEDLHKGWFGVNPTQFEDDFWDDATVTIRKIEKIDDETGYKESGQVRFYAKWGDTYYGINAYDFDTLTPNDLVSGGVNKKPNEGVYGSTSTIPDSAEFWMEGVRPGKITLEWRYQKGDADFKYEQTFLVATQQSKQKWWEDVSYQIRLQTKVKTGSEVDMDQYHPGDGFRNITPDAPAGHHNVPRVYATYYYYQQLFKQRPEELMWAGMAKTAGAPVIAGMSDLTTWWQATDPIPPFDDRDYGLEVVIDLFLLDGNKTIFLDMAWAHRAYLASGMRALDFVKDNELPLQANFEAWRKIDNGISGGNTALINEGNDALLKREQEVVMQPIYFNRLANTWIKQPPLQSWLGAVAVPENSNGLGNAGEWFSANSNKNPMPGGPGFRATVPNGRIDNFLNRWTWIHNTSNGMLQIWTGDATGVGAPKFNPATRLLQNNKTITTAVTPYSIDPGGLPSE